MTRKAISKRVRFDIFKRDGFECQYCGAAPPGVLLHIDHITPVMDGGGNELDNLVTACADCNLGKGARSLLAVPQSLKDKAAEVAEREAQLRGYQEILDAKRDRLEWEIDRVAEVYERFFPGYTISDVGRVSVKRFVDLLGVSPCEEAMEIAGSRMAGRDSKIFKYFCGICWRKIREAGLG